MVSSTGGSSGAAAGSGGFSGGLTGGSGCFSPLAGVAVAVFGEGPIVGWVAVDGFLSFPVSRAVVALGSSALGGGVGFGAMKVPQTSMRAMITSRAMMAFEPSCFWPSGSKSSNWSIGVRG